MPTSRYRLDHRRLIHPQVRARNHLHQCLPQVQPLSSARRTRMISAIKGDRFLHRTVQRPTQPHSMDNTRQHKEGQDMYTPEGVSAGLLGKVQHPSHPCRIIPGSQVRNW